MSTANTIANGHASGVSTLTPTTVYPFVPQQPTEPSAGAIASLDDPAPRTETPSTTNLDSLWTLLNERVARAAQQTPAAPIAPIVPEVQAMATVAEAVPTVLDAPTAYGTAVSETYVVTATPGLNLTESTADAVVSAQTPEIITSETLAPELVAPVVPAEALVPTPPVAATPDVLMPTIVTPAAASAPVAPTPITPLTELLTATARRRATPPVRLENSIRNGALVLGASAQGYGLPNINLELAAPLTKTVQSGSRTGETHSESHLLALLESVETGGEGRTSLKAIVGYAVDAPDIVIEISCEDGKDWQFSTQENGSDVSVEWEVTRQRGKAIVISAAIGRAKGEEDVILELSRTMLPPTEDATSNQWRNLVALKQPASH